MSKSTLHLLAGAILGATLCATAALADNPAPASKWRAPRTADGHPDLQGNWTNATITLFETLVVETTNFRPDQSYRGSSQNLNMKARYEFPLDTQADVVIAGTFNGSSAEGTWSLVPKGGDQVFAGGGWKVTKK